MCGEEMGDGNDGEEARGEGGEEREGEVEREEGEGEEEGGGGEDMICKNAAHVLER